MEQKNSPSKAHRWCVASELQIGSGQNSTTSIVILHRQRVVVYGSRAHAGLQPSSADGKENLGFEAAKNFAQRIGSAEKLCAADRAADRIGKKLRATRLRKNFEE
jgi:hypothetical protein